jgi:hypothetical protein
MEFTEHRFQEMSEIEVRFFTRPASAKPYLKILVVKYTGKYGFGSGGNDDAVYMRAMARAGIETFRPWGVIHDLTELSYEWGDALEEVFIGPTFEPSPMAIVVGPKCEEALRTLLLGLDSKDPIEKAGNVFRSLDAAWAYVDVQIK